MMCNETATVVFFLRWHLQYGSASPTDVGGVWFQDARGTQLAAAPALVIFHSFERGVSTSIRVSTNVIVQF
jgi:hypothetical protein